MKRLLPNDKADFKQAGFDFVSSVLKYIDVSSLLITGPSIGIRTPWLNTDHESLWYVIFTTLITAIISSSVFFASGGQSARTRVV